jgi:hypothetical protein
VTPEGNARIGPLGAFDWIRDPVVHFRLVHISRMTDPARLGPCLAELRDDARVYLDIDPPFPEAIVAATAAALEGRPEIWLSVEGRVWDSPGLSFDRLEQFPHVRHLGADVYDALDLSPIRHLHDLRTLSLGETKRRSLSLAFLRETPLIERLSIDGTGGRDFDAVGELRHLRMFDLRAPRTKTLDPLQEHPTLEGMTITLGGIRDLTPLATIPTCAHSTSGASACSTPTTSQRSATARISADSRSARSATCATSPPSPADRPRRSAS